MDHGNTKIRNERRGETHLAETNREYGRSPTYSTTPEYTTPLRRNDIHQEEEHRVVSQTQIKHSDRGSKETEEQKSSQSQRDRSQSNQIEHSDLNGYGRSGNVEDLLRHFDSLMPARCALPPLGGRCDQRNQRWYFDHVDNACKTFIFGGCEGNNNNYASLRECQAICQMKKMVEGQTSHKGQ